MDCLINVTIHNEGINDIEGLLLSVNITGVSSENYSAWNEPIGIIRSGESKTIQASILTGLDVMNKVAGHSAEFKLMLNGELLHSSFVFLPFG